MEVDTVGNIFDYQLEGPGSIFGLIKGCALTDLLSPHCLRLYVQGR